MYACGCVCICTQEHYRDGMFHWMYRLHFIVICLGKYIPGLPLILLKWQLSLLLSVVTDTGIITEVAWFYWLFLYHKWLGIFQPEWISWWQVMTAVNKILLFHYWFIEKHWTKPQTVRSGVWSCLNINILQKSVL